MDLCDLPAYQIADLVRTRQVSAVEVLDSCLDRVRVVDGRPGRLSPGEITPEDEEHIHAFISCTEEMARTQAEEVDKRVAQGQNPGSLAGVPITVKDIFTVKGSLTTPLPGYCLLTKPLTQLPLSNGRWMPGLWSSGK